MNPLQILIRKSGYAIHNGTQQRDVVTNIQRMDEALEIFRELSRAISPYHPHGDWPVVPGVLVVD